MRPESKVSSLFDSLTNVLGRAAGHGRFLFVHILGDFQYAGKGVSIQEHLVDLPLVFQDEFLGCESLWVRSRLISLFGVNQPTGHCMQTVLSFQVAAIALDENQTVGQFMPVLISDTDDGTIGDYGYDGEPALRFPEELDSTTKAEITQSIVSLLMSEPHALGTFFDHWACEYDGSIESIECDGAEFHREFLGYLAHHELEDPDQWALEGCWPFTLPRARRRRTGLAGSPSLRPRVKQNSPTHR